MTNIIKAISKILLILIIIQIIFAIVNTSESASIWSDMYNEADSFIDAGKDGSQNNQIIMGNISAGSVKSIINDIYNILFPLAVVITVIVGGILGIKFMLASAEDKAKIKESLVPYIIGCAVIYGAFGIWKVAITIFSILD